MKIFVDMDGVLADFDAMKKKMDMDGERLKTIPGAYRNLQPIEGAIKGMHSLIGTGAEVYIASRPATGLGATYADKVDWIMEHLPVLKRNVILTHNKGLLGGEDDVLVDDRPHRADCWAFKGTLIKFTQPTDWQWIPRYVNHRIRCVVTGWQRGVWKHETPFWKNPGMRCLRCATVIAPHGAVTEQQYATAYMDHACEGE